MMTRALSRSCFRSWTGMGLVTWMVLAVLAGAEFAAPAQAPLATPRTRPRSPRPPNIIFILADDLGYGDLGCYGQTKIKTPHLDQLAAEGMRFTRCYAGTTVCAPSRAALMTGLHTGHVSIRGNDTVPLGSNEVTVAQVLHQGPIKYETACVGKWGLGEADSSSTPPRKGFDEWFGYLNQTHAHAYYPTQLWRSSVSAGIDNYPVPFLKNANGAKGEYAHDLFTKVATNFVRGARYNPFFLYLAYTIPHANNEMKEKGMEIPTDAPYTQESWPQSEKNKAAMITRLDRDIGLLLAQLKAMRLDEDTIVFFASDNGPHREGGVRPEFFNSSGPLRGIKRDLYEGGIRVPMLARWPGFVPRGVVSDQPWAFWDFLPTAAELAGAPSPAGLDGISIVPTLLGRKQTNQHEFLYFEFHEAASQQAVIMQDWKAVRLAPGRALELYNLKSDPAETNNVAATQPEVVARIENYLKTARSESAHWPLRSAPAQTPAAKPVPN